MSEAIGLDCCTVHQVYILPEDSADSEHPVYLQIMGEQERANQVV